MHRGDRSILLGIAGLILLNAALCWATFEFLGFI